ncbi:VOC family protein [Nocardioides sp.]|uniref:VOC family protein n=1 Tax=Nocardioides sp. TaxID=35761 RepID=UPI00351874CC
MTSFVSHTTIDCADAHALSRWWEGVLGYEQDPADPNLPGHEECLIRDPDTGHTLLFIEVPDGPKTTKNRLHLDLRPRTGTRDDEAARLLAHGATLVADHRGIHGPGSGWWILADPEGNEFCVLRSRAELAGG